MRTVRAALFALALSLVAAPAFAQGFLKIDGVEGESADDKHKLEIDIDSVRVKGQDLHIVKKIDKASPKLAALAGKKASLPGTVVVVLDKPYKRKHGKQEEFLKVVLNAPWVSSRTAAPSAPVLETVVFSTKSFDVYESASSAGPWVKVDAATLKRDYPTIFLP
jgi:type VI protein secretion system component Hcp